MFVACALFGTDVMLMFVQPLSLAVVSAVAADTGTSSGTVRMSAGAVGSGIDGILVTVLGS